MICQVYVGGVLPGNIDRTEVFTGGSLLGRYQGSAQTEEIIEISSGKFIKGSVVVIQLHNELRNVPKQLSFEEGKVNYVESVTIYNRRDCCGDDTRNVYVRHIFLSSTPVRTSALAGLRWPYNHMSIQRFLPILR